MKKKRTYNTVDVEEFDVTALMSVLTLGCIVAVDVAKTKFVAAIAKGTGEVLRLIRFEHPRQTPVFLRLLETLRDAKLAPRVVMEPTGTYGDALRYQCHQRQLTVQMVPPKHTHDFAEVLDGVPSMHDAKAAVVLAQLAAIKDLSSWTPESDETRDLRAVFDQRGPTSKTLALYFGHLEAMLARHWPEFGVHVDVHRQRSWMSLLRKYPGPQRVASAKDDARVVLHNASRGGLGAERIEAIVLSACTTLGVPMTTGEQEKLRAIVEQIEVQTRRLDTLDERLAEMTAQNEVMSHLAPVVGIACASAILSYVGSPRDFPNAGALEKGIGLNLKERSSGEKKGQLSITKRGPGQVRQLLYLAALRCIQDDPIVCAWYRGRRSYQADTKKKAIVAVMRKLTRALWHVARGAAFDATKLFDVRRLDAAISVTTTTASDASASAVARASTRFGARKAPLMKPSQGGVSLQA